MKQNSDSIAKTDRQQGTCETCTRPTCMQRTTTSNAYKHCKEYTHSQEEDPDPWNCADMGINECGEEWCEWPCEIWLRTHDAAVRKDEREKVLNELLLPVESAIGEASDNGDYVVQACFNDCKNWIEQARGRS